MKPLDEYPPEFQELILKIKRLSFMMREAKTPEELALFEPLIKGYEDFLAINREHLKAHLENSLKNSP